MAMALGPPADRVGQVGRFPAHSAGGVRFQDPQIELVSAGAICRHDRHVHTRIRRADPLITRNQGGNPNNSSRSITAFLRFGCTHARKL